MSSTNAKPVHRQSAYELRRSIGELLRTDFGNSLAELERRFKELVEELERKESAPPRSDFWDLRVMIDKQNLSNYNRINNTEVVAAVWKALKLEHVGEIDHLELACRTGDEYSGEFVVHLADFVLASFPAHMRTLCNNFFLNNVVKFEFFMKAKRCEAETCDTTSAAEMRTALCKVHAAVYDIEIMRGNLKKKMEEYTEPLKKALKDDLETVADSDAEESDEEDSDDEGRPTGPSPKRRKTYDQVGLSKDTTQQQVSLAGITLSSGSSVESMRIREFRGEPEPHFVDVMGAIATGDERVVSKRLPCPRAPTYSHGAEPTISTRGENFKLEPPGADVNSNTAVTQKLMDIDNECDTNLVAQYEAMHRLAHSLRSKIRKMVQTINEELDFVVRVHTSDGQHTDYQVGNLTVMQRYAIGNLYLHSIAVHQESVPETEESADQDAEDDEVDSSDEEFSVASSDDDDDEDEDDDPDASGDDDASDDDE